MNQTPPLPVPPSNLGAEHRTKDRRTGRLLVGSGAFNLVMTLVVVALLMILAQVTAVNGSLADALSQQRDQFTNCKDKPAGTRGCTQPVAAEPSVIVKQNKPVVGLPGSDGADGSAGKDGRDGRDGVDGKNGKDGVTPPCMKTPRQCVGADGKPAPTPPPAAPGKDGKDGKDGADGLTPACWFEVAQCRGADGKDGKDGAMGVQGNPGVSVSSTQCITDDTTTGSHWLITYKDGAQETSPGPCRIKTP